MCVAVHRTSLSCGSYEVWEFASKTQATGTPGYKQLENKIKAMKAANPGAIFHDIIPW